MWRSGSASACATDKTCFAGVCGSACDAGAPVTRVFVTSQHYSADFAYHAGVADGLAGADALCALAASSASPPGTFRAWLSSSTVDAIDRIADFGPWYRVGTCEPVFLNKAKIVVDGPLMQITWDEEGGPTDPYYANTWTGTSASGRRTIWNCNDWRSSSAWDYNGTVGRVRFYSSSSWTNSGETGCDLQARLYCIQQ